MPAADVTDPGVDPGTPDDGGFAARSSSIAAWTVVSRVSGFVRVVVVAAVLGPTYVGNVYLAATLLPQLALELVAGSLLQTALLPGLVRSVDRGDRRASERLAGGYLGAVLLALSAVALLAILLGPLLLIVLSLGVQDAAVAEQQQRVGWILLALTMPQVPLLGLAFISVTAMNANGRFALGAAAPTVENVGVVAVMGLSVLLYGAGPSLEGISTGHLLLLGGGTTVAVVLHAALCWWGARRAGLTLRPNAGWRDSEVRTLLSRSRTALGQAAVTAGRAFAALAVANSVAGGVVAFRLALNFFHLPMAIGARPIAVAQQPTLARLFHRGADDRWQQEYAQGLATVLFLVVPAAVTYAVLAGPLAAAASAGEMAAGDGDRLVAVALAALAAGVVGESVFQVSTYASYARDDARTPFRAALVGMPLSLVGMGVALASDDATSVLVALGAGMSAGTLASGWWLARSLTAHEPVSRSAVWPAALRAFAASAVMAVPAWLVASALRPEAGGLVGTILAVGAAVLVGAGVFLAAQRLWRSPELALLLGAVRGRTG